MAYVQEHDPQMSDTEALLYLDAMFERTDKKRELLARGMSNQMAERFLDRQGWPRPFGWHTVFFYPDSNRLRTRYAILLAVIVGVLAWRVLSNG